VHLRHIHKGLLVMFAGGDPWKINASLQKGQPGQISELAEGFHNAGRSTQAADNAFTDARNRLNAWTHDNGEHPITDSNKVQQVAKALGLQATQLPKIAVNLENVAAALAQAQTTAAGDIATLEARLQYLDDWIGWAEDRIQQDEAAIAETDDEDEIAKLRDDEASCQDGITACEKEAVDDTKTTLQQVTQVRQAYSNALQGAETNLRAEGFNPAAIQALDADAPEDQLPGQVPRTGLESGQLNDLQRATDQAVIDQMAKVRAAQGAVNAAVADVLKNGPGSAQADAATERLPQLRKALADAIDDLGKIPNYHNNIDPTTMSTDESGRFLFSYNINGQNVQVTGQFKNGTGQFFDQGTGTSYTFKDGKLVGMQTPDPGQVSATVEPLWSAVTLAVGGPELKALGEAGLQALKAGGGRAWQGLSSLFGREGAAGLGDLTQENVLPRAVAAAEQRTTDAQHYLMTHPPVAAPGAGGAADAGGAGAGGVGVGVGEHPGATGAGGGGGPGGDGGGGGGGAGGGGPGGPPGGGGEPPSSAGAPPGGGGGGHPGGGGGPGGAEEPVPGGAPAPAVSTGGGHGGPGGGGPGEPAPVGAPASAAGAADGHGAPGGGLGPGGHPEPAPVGAPASAAGAADGHGAPLPGGAGAGEGGGGGSGGAAGGGGTGDGVGDGNAGYGGAGEGDNGGPPLEGGQPPIQSDALPPPPAPPDSPLFDGYEATDPGPEFTDSDGQLIYPDDSLESKPYAIPGTVVPDANLPTGMELGRFGYPGGAYLTPEGTPFAELSLPPSSAAKPYYQYVVKDGSRLPPGWRIEESKVAPWFHQPGGGIQFRVIDDFGANGSVEELIRWGFLRRVN
jgi:hypothetical protein